MVRFFPYFYKLCFWVCLVGGQTLFCLRAPYAEAKPETSIALHGKAKNHKDFPHYAHVNPNAPKGGHLNLSAVGTFDSLNPFVIKGTAAAGLLPLSASMFYVTLMDHSPNEVFSQYPYLAESIEMSEDGLSVCFRIRDQATFHDGSLITVEDVIFSFQTLIKEGVPLYRQYYGDVVKVVKTGPFHVTFTFKDNKNKELPLLLGQFPVFSKAYYTRNDFQDATVKVPLGNGPYRVVAVDPGASITYERVKNWWGANLPVNKGRYNFDQVRYLYFRDPEVAFEAFKAHDIDFRLEGKIQKWMTGYDFEAVHKGHVKKLQIPVSYYGLMRGLFMNTRRELFSDKRVRRALALALDFEWLNDNYFYNQYERIDSYFWGLDLASSGKITQAERRLLEPFKAQVPQEVFDHVYTLPKNRGGGQNRQALRQAQALLKEAGWGVKDGLLRHKKTGVPFEFKILLRAASMTGLLNSYLKNLKRLGIIATFRLVDMSQYMSRVEAFDYDMILTSLGQSLSPGNEQRDYWGSYVAVSKGSKNYAGIKDPVVDQLIEKIIDAQDRKTLKTATQALDRLLLWGHYVVPLWGSSKIRQSYWHNLQHTDRFPTYIPDIFSWWHIP